jgi:hypothetical protein
LMPLLITPLLFDAIIARHYAIAIIDYADWLFTCHYAIIDYFIDYYFITLILFRHWCHYDYWCHYFHWRHSILLYYWCHADIHYWHYFRHYWWYWLFSPH